MAGTIASDGNLIFKTNNGLTKTDTFGTSIWNFTIDDRYPKHEFKSAIETEDGKIIATGISPSGKYPNTEYDLR